jgi:hypothetical protein
MMYQTCHELQARQGPFIREEAYRQSCLVATLITHQTKAGMFHLDGTKDTYQVEIKKSQLEDAVEPVIDHLTYARQRIGELKELLCRLRSARVRGYFIQTPTTPKSQRK